MLALLVSSSALLPSAKPPVANVASSSRRSVLAAAPGVALGAAALTAAPAAWADSIEEIAAKANAKAAAEREQVRVEKIRQEGEGANAVGGAVAASLLLSVPLSLIHI